MSKRSIGWCLFSFFSWNKKHHRKVIEKKGYQATIIRPKQVVCNCWIFSYFHLHIQVRCRPSCFKQGMLQDPKVSALKTSKPRCSNPGIGGTLARPPVAMTALRKRNLRSATWISFLPKKVAFQRWRSEEQWTNMSHQPQKMLQIRVNSS